jgi:hypothetical protein
MQRKQYKEVKKHHEHENVAEFLLHFYNSLTGKNIIIAIV